MDVVGEGRSKSHHERVQWVLGGNDNWEILRDKGPVLGDNGGAQQGKKVKRPGPAGLFCDRSTRKARSDEKFAEVLQQRPHSGTRGV